jgi:hypothetical protein
MDEPLETNFFDRGRLIPPAFSNISERQRPLLGLSFRIGDVGWRASSGLQKLFPKAFRHRLTYKQGNISASAF